MRKLIYSMNPSLDGFIADADGAIDWGAPDEELHQFHNDEVRELGAHLLGRRLYETMVYWETADQDPAADPIIRDFAAVWQALPKIVFSTTLKTVEGNTRLATDSLADEIARLKAEPGKDIAIGGAGLAAEATRLGLIDEYRLFLNPILLGAGTPYFPPLEARVPLELIETRAFAVGVVYVRYGRA
jgi:dihydrofolate reductase